MNIIKKIETIGNRLPDPATLFVIGIVLIALTSVYAAMQGWQVESPAKGLITANNLISSDGIWWLLSSLVKNFIEFPPLGIVLVGMLGIGLAEKSGFLPSLLHYIAVRIPKSLLAPFAILLGILSSMTLDAGYVVLPPLFAALYQTAGRSPLAGIAASFAGVSAGFSANLSVTALDPLLGGFTESAAQIINADYAVANTANLWFMMASTLLLSLAGWWISERWVEPNIRDIQCENTIDTHAPASREDSFALAMASACFVGMLLLFFMATKLEGWPLYGSGNRFDRWIEATVPLLFLIFFIPSLLYGILAGTIRSDRDATRMLNETFAGLGSYIVLAFFAAQFIACFKYTSLGEILAIHGGQLLVEWQLSSQFLLSSFIGIVILANLFIGSASAKYAFMAPVFVPMFMQAGISPELTQAAYRIGDSASNVITPLNPYMIIIVVLVQKYVKGSGVGTVIAVMLPYAIGFAVIWIGFLLLWVMLGIPLGPASALLLEP